MTQMEIDVRTIAAARKLIDACRGAGVRVALAESCTGGLLGGCLTDVPGASAVVERGFITYSNEAKSELLGVPVELIRTHGAVSEQVAAEMVQGALARSPADLAVAVTGIAGPTGGTAEKPVGLVQFAVARRDGPVRSERRVFEGDRRRVREAAVAFAIGLLTEAV